MSLPLSRYGLIAALALCSLCCATGCRSGAWGWPSSSSNWLSWKNWGKSTSADTTALASKPTTTAPKPSASAIPQPTTSIAAGTGASSPATTATANNTAYPTTSPSYASTYATQPAAYGQAGATNQVQPSVGYQTGPYNVNTTAAAGASGGYNQPAASGSSWNQDTSGYGAATSGSPNYSGQGYAAQGNTAQGYGSQNQSPAGYATAAPSGDYRTADGRSMYGTQEASPYSNDPAQQGGYGTGSYNQPAASGTTGGYAAPSTSGTGAAPASTTNPWNNYQAPPPNTYGAAQPAAGNTAPPAGGNTAGYGAAAAPPAANGYPAVPATLATSAGSYRPGSTAAAGDGVQNAAYTQPTASGPSASGSINYGNSYLR